MKSFSQLVIATGIVFATIAAPVLAEDQLDAGPSPADAPAPAIAPAIDVPREAAVAPMPEGATQGTDGDDAAPDHEKSKKKKKHHTEGKEELSVKYKPGKGVDFKADDFRLRFEMFVQPVARLTGSSAGPLQAEVLLRRVRLAFDGRAPGGFKSKIELQIKNDHVGLGSIYGAWQLDDKSLEIVAGYTKPPGGLERDSSTFDLPTAERSVVAYLTYDKEIGVKAKGVVGDFRYGLFLSRPAPAGIDGGDPEDTSQPADPEDAARVLLSPYRWDVTAGGAWTPSETLEVGLNGGVRIRPDGDFGDRLAEPFDASVFGAHPYRGTGFHVGADAALVAGSFKGLVEGGFRQDGAASDPQAVGNLDAVLGYLVLGWTPNGHYGPAIDSAPLEDGWELFTRIEGAHLTPAQNDGKAGTWLSGLVGAHWEVAPQLRLQSDLAYEVFDENTLHANDRLIYFEIWATFRL